MQFVNGLGNRLLDREEAVEVENLAQEETKAKFDEILERTEPAMIFP